MSLYVKLRVFLTIRCPSEFDLSLVLRGLFASAVVIWHVHGHQGDIPSVLNIPGRVSVWMFFGISGYVISHGFFHGRIGINHSDLRYYVKRRVARILPLFAVLSAIAILILLSRGEPIPFGLAELPAQLFTIQWQHDYALVGVFWTLGVELQFYIIAPFLIILLMLVPNRWLIMILTLWFTIWLMIGAGADDRSVIAALPHFLTGILIARASIEPSFDRLVNKRGFAVVCAIGFLLSLVVVNLLYNNDLSSFWKRWGILLTDIALVFGLLLHCSLEAKKIAVTRFTRIFLVVGILSYGLYAWHGLLLTYFDIFSTQFLLLYATSLVLANGSYILVERPILNLTRRTQRSLIHSA